MKKLNYILLLCVLSITIQSTAQQDPTYTIYNYNMNVINPAYVGSEEKILINSNFRSQWTKLPDAPEIQSFSISAPLGKNIGLGLSLVNDKVSVLRETDVYVDMSYRLKITEESDLYLGLKAGGSFINIDLQSLGINDDPVFGENVSRFNPNIGAGVYFKNKKYFVNVSTPVLLSSKRYEKEGSLVTKASDKIHIYAGGGYTFDLNDNFTLMPSVMTRFVQGVPFSMDISATLGMFNRVELGVSHRLEESISGILLFKLADWGKLGYAYDHTISDIGSFSSGSHEILIRFML